jgi:hypothetical protein
MRYPSLAGIALLSVVGARAWSDWKEPTLDELRSKAALLKPTPEESRWQRIPWLTDLAEAQRVAQEERRPIFLFASGYDPLQRC